MASPVMLKISSSSSSSSSYLWQSLGGRKTIHRHQTCFRNRPNLRNTAQSLPNCRITASASIPNWQLRNLRPQVVLQNVKEIGVGSLNLVKNPYVAPVVVAASLACVLAPLLLRAIHDKCFGGGDYEWSFCCALEKPLQFLLLFFPLTSCLPSMSTTELQLTAVARRHAAVLSLIWLLHRWKTNFVSYILNLMRAEGANPVSITIMKLISIVGSIYLGMLAYYQLMGRALEYVLLFVLFIVFPFLYATRKLLAYLVRSWFGEGSQHSSIEGPVQGIGKILHAGVDGQMALVITIPMARDNVEKFPVISKGIISMLKLNSDVVSEGRVPYCYLLIEGASIVNLNLECSLKQMAEEEAIKIKDHILEQCYDIIRKH